MPIPLSFNVFISTLFLREKLTRLLYVIIRLKQAELEAYYAPDERRQKECGKNHQMSNEVKTKIFEIKIKELDIFPDELRHMYGEY